MSTKFIEWLQVQMDKAGLNQNELAQKSGLYPSNISMVLSGEKNPGVDFFIKIARGLRLSPGYVFEQYASSVTDKATGDQQLIMKTTEVMKLLAELEAEGDIRLVYDFAEMLLKRQEGSN